MPRTIRRGPTQSAANPGPDPVTYRKQGRLWYLNGLTIRDDGLFVRHPVGSGLAVRFAPPGGSAGEGPVSHAGLPG